MALTQEEFRNELRVLLRARFPIVLVDTFEEDRALSEIIKVAEGLRQEVVLWSTSEGVRHATATHHTALLPKNPMADLVVAIEAFEKLVSAKEAPKDGSLLVLLDPHPYLSDRNANPIYRRRLRDLAIRIRSKGYRANCVMISPVTTLPIELEKEVTVVDFPMPNRADVARIVHRFADLAKTTPGVEIANHGLLDALIDASLGLTMVEIENVLTRAVVEDRHLDYDDVETVFGQKQQIIRKSGILEYVDTRGLSLDQVGGLDSLKEWLRIREAGFSEEGKAYGLQTPKGVLLTGVPGCGKSWSAKCVAASWHLPLIRLDMGKVYSSLIGSSEENLRHAIATCEAVAPCVLWIDEIEKGLPPRRGYIGDSGVSLRILGGLLTWMQEKSSPVFVVGTANQLEHLPPEMLRKGRFDEVFFVDLPTPEERHSILSIHIRRAGRDPADFALDRLVEASGERVFGSGVVLSGAELEAWTNEALIRSFVRFKSGEGSDKLSTDDFLAVAPRLIPLARVRSDEIAAMRAWAEEHAVPATLRTNREPDGAALDRRLRIAAEGANAPRASVA